MICTVDTFGDPVHNVMISATLQIVGCQNMVWENLGAIDASTPRERADFLKKAAALLEN